MNSSKLRRRHSVPRGLALPVVALVTLVALVATIGCANRSEPRVEGRLASGGGYLGDWDLYPNRCTKRGDEIVLRENGDTKRSVRLIDRSRGGPSALAKIEVRVDGDTPNGPREVLLTDAACVKGAVDTRGGTRGGDLQFNCSTGEGGHIVGTVHFADCR